MVLKTGTEKKSVLVHLPGAPNEDIVQNHLNIALLNVIKYLRATVRKYRPSSSKG